MIPKKLFIIGFALLTLVFSIAAPFFPWWRAYTSRKSDIESGTSIRVEYGLLGSITASKITNVENQSVSMSISISELNATEQDKNALQSFLYNTWCLSIAGSGFSILTFVFICLSIGEKFVFLKKYTKYLMIVTGIIFFVSSVYFASQAHVLISKLENVTPSQVYYFSGKEVRAFFGKINSLIYGPSFGWYLAITGFLLNISLSLLTIKVKE